MIKTQPIDYGQRLYLKGDADAPSFAKTWRATLERDVAPITMATVERLRFGDDVPLDERFDVSEAVLQDQFLDANAQYLTHEKNNEDVEVLAMRRWDEGDEGGSCLMSCSDCSSEERWVTHC